MKRFALIGLALAGCAQTPPAPSTVPPPPVASAPSDHSAGPIEVKPTDACRIATVADLVGEPVTPELQRDAQGKVGANSSRVIGPGSVVTMDYRPDRLNIVVDDKQVVQSFRCG